MRLIVIVALAAMLSACAMTEDVVPIAYAPIGGERVAGAEAIRVTVSAIDARAEHRDRIATKINGYEVEMAAIRLDGEVTDVVRQGLLAEFRSRGYALADGGAKVEVKVVTFYNTFTNGSFAGRSDGVVDLVVTVVSDGAPPLYTRDVRGKARRSVQNASGKNAAATLSAAMADGLRALFEDPAFMKALENGGAISARSAEAGSSLD